MILTNSNHALKKNSNKLFAPLININDFNVFSSTLSSHGGWATGS